MTLEPIESPTMSGPLTLFAVAIIIGGMAGVLMAVMSAERKKRGIGDTPVLVGQFVIPLSFFVFACASFLIAALAFIPGIAYKHITGHDAGVSKDAAVETISLDGAEKGPNLQTRHKWIDTKTILDRTDLPVYVTDIHGYTMGSKAATAINLYGHTAQTEGAPMSWVGADLRIHTKGRMFANDDGGVRITDGKGNAPDQAPSSKMLDSMTVTKVKGDATAMVEKMGREGNLHLSRGDDWCDIPDEISGVIPMVCGSDNNYMMKVAIKGGGYAIPVNFAGRILLADGDDMAAGKASIRIVDPVTVR